jgi:hypothetical protein
MPSPPWRIWARRPGPTEISPRIAIGATVADNTASTSQKPSNWLLTEHAQNFQSQCGEDGILAAILDRLPETNRWCVEFGAWDGVYFSNTRELVKSRGYFAVLIEGDPARAVALRSLYAGQRQIYPVNALVGWNESDSLDAILQGNPVPIDFDVLSIDIDGNDYHAWAAVKTYRPKVVLIEFNPTCGTDVEYVQPPDPRIQRGSSLLSLTKLGRRKGYELVSVTDWNAIFVTKELFPLFEVADNSPRALRPSEEHVTHIFCGFDGTVMMSGRIRMLWQPYDIPIRQLPWWLRGFRDHEDTPRRIAGKFYRKYVKFRNWLTNPR